MAKIHVADLVADLRQFNFIRNKLRTVNSDPTNPINKAMKKGAERVARWLRRRFIWYASQGGQPEWPDIDELTKKRKGSDLILRETDELLNAIGVAKSGDTGGYAAGYVTNRAFNPHHRYPGTVAGLAVLLQDGIRNGKSWDIIVPPTETIRRKVVNDVDFAMRLMLRQSRTGTP